MNGGRLTPSSLLLAVGASLGGSLAVSAASGCSSTTTSGGEARFDAAPPPRPVVAGEGVDGGGADATADATADAGSSWADLHRDFFGPTGQASCAGDGACHGAANQAGAKVTGFVCAGGRDECYAGMTNDRTKLVVPGDTTTPPDQTLLHMVLRKTDGTGLMPKRPAFVFAVADMARIDAWIARGAPNDSQ